MIGIHNPDVRYIPDTRHYVIKFLDRNFGYILISIAIVVTHYLK